MNSLNVSLLLLAIICLGAVCCEPHFAEMPPGSESPRSSTGNTVGSPHQNTLLANAENEARGADPDPFNSDKRMERYAFGLGRRAFTYTTGGGSGNGVKRLPVYNFGLGKRARPYSFGLGKRAEYDEDHFEDSSNSNSYGGGGNIGDYERSMSAFGEGPYNVNFLDEKRSRPYSFGLGKRSDGLDDVERRGYPNRYGFGLGRR